MTPSTGSASGALLDVNLLVGLVWPHHPFHHSARAWFAEHSAGGWATCAITSPGFIRVSCTAAVVVEPLSPPEAVEALAQLTAQGRPPAVGRGRTDDRGLTRAHAQGRHRRLPARARRAAGRAPGHLRPEADPSRGWLAPNLG